MDARSDPPKLKFHGELGTSDDCVAQYDKKEFIQAVKEQVAYYGLWKLFSMPTAGGTMKNLILDYHIFELDDIIKEY